jgi:hypothetical protein
LRIHDVKRTGFLTGENPLNLAKRAFPVKHFQSGLLFFINWRKNYSESVSSLSSTGSETSKASSSAA